MLPIVTFRCVVGSRLSFYCQDDSAKLQEDVLDRIALAAMFEEPTHGCRVFMSRQRQILMQSQIAYTRRTAATRA